jgi:amino acid adenylation domain-containing protein
VESGGEIHGAFSYNTDLYEAASIERMAGHFMQLLESIAQDSQASLATISMLTEAERAEQVVAWNQTKRGYEGAETLPELVEAQVARTPEQVALRYQGEVVSYRELNRRANQVAHYLRALGVGAETVVGLLLERSVEMVVGLLGILKAGGAYLPIDPEYPPERISFMLEDAGVAVLLTHEAAAAALPAYWGQTIYLDRDRELIAAASAVNPAPAVTGENPAYVLYTSGSTGRPKGVMVPHRAIANHMQWMLGELEFSGGDRVLQKTPYTFDASVWEFYAPLMCGGALVMAAPGVHRDAAALVRELAAQQITQLQVVPTMLKLLLEEAELSECKELRRVFCGGEALTMELAERFREQLAGVELCNLYGPTEATIDASIWSSASGGDVTLGRPIWNTELYVLGRELELLPVGVAGELYIGGAGLARGYIGRAELTAARFIPHPYSAVGGERLYRTGDLARYLASGELEYLGRADEQVKVRGFRIELGEIEAVLSRHQQLREAVVTVREDQVRGTELMAYVVAEGEAGPSSGELREFLGAKLPAYMIPQSFVFLSSLPLTPSGKIDRRALPAPAPMSSEREESFVAPRDMTELQMVQVWEDILAIRPVGVNDNFFHLGVHSLLAVRMVAQLEKRLHCRIPLAALFEEATINHLAKLQRRQMVALRESSLIPIRTSGSRSPIFFVHPVGGRVFCYTALAAYLDLDRPFYGFQSPVSEDGEPMFTTIESMAAHYVEELRAVQPEGPYFLGGWSMGGVVAFEMALQLQRLEQEVKLLALVDSMIPHFARPGVENVSVTNNTLPDNNAEPLQEATLLISFAMDLGLSLELLALTPADLLTIEPAQQLTYVLDQARQASVVPADLDLSVIQRLYALFKNNHRALWNYVPKPYAGPALLIKATERENSIELDPALGWNKLVADLQIRETPGTHYTIVREPYVRTLGQQLEKYCSHLEESALDHTHLAFAG